MLIVAMVGVVVISGCSSSKDSKKTVEGTTSPSSTSSSTPKVADDPFGKYNPPIEVTTVRNVNASFKYENDETIDKNVWTTIFENELGIKLKNVWSVDGAQFAQKQNVTIASGDLPDFMQVDKVTLFRLIEAGSIEDLTKAYDRFASPFTKNVLQKDGGAALKSVTIDGKLMAIPQTDPNGGVSQGNLLWVRTDWLKTLNLPEPKTIDDVINIADAFLNKDPDGNGKKDTGGLGVNNLLFQDPGTLAGFFNGFHAYPASPHIWIKNDAGKLVFGPVQPQMKTALQKLQEMYAKGIIDKEFGTKPWQKVAEDVGAGKIGILYGNIADPAFVQKNNRTNNPKAEWKPFPIVSSDGRPALVVAGPTAFNYYVVKKGSAHPEAPVKLLNVFLKKFMDTDYAGAKNPFAINPETGINKSLYAPVQVSPVDLNITAHLQVLDSLKSGDGSKLGFPANIHFKRITSFRNGDDTAWFGEKMMGPEGSFSIINQYMKQKSYVSNEFTGAPTPTMQEKEATFKKMIEEMVTKIIMGAAPISDFDKFVTDWKKLGGDQIEKEVNDWYSKKK